MNIFQVLSQGKSRLHEPSMSAMLGYLLDSNEDHGLGQAFVKVFLQKTDAALFEKVLSQSSINSSVILESSYELNGSRKDIDIEISLLDENREIAYTIIIENKIKTGAANPKQLGDYYNAILQDDPKIKNLLIVFLTPESNAPQLNAEFNNLKVNESLNHHKKWMYWNSANNNEGILAMVREVLNMEAQGQINPINEYMRHTLKAFVQYSSFAVQSKELKTIRRGEDIGQEIKEAIITLKDGTSYRVVLRDSAQIQVFNSKTEDKEVARRILSKFIDEKEINILHRELNTRVIGKRVLEWLSNNPSQGSKV